MSADEKLIQLLDLFCGEGGAAYGYHAAGFEVYGALRKRHWERPGGNSRGRKATSLEEGREAMGMPWASWQGLTQAIPPSYTEHIGEQLMRAARSINEGGSNA